MAEGRETRSAHTSTRDTPHPRRNETASMHRGPFIDRADGGHIAPSVGKSGPAPVVGMPRGVMRDKGRRV
jgi:hypothetical protein